MTLKSIAMLSKPTQRQAPIYKKIGSLKKGTRFEMGGLTYVITRSGHGYIDVEFIRPENPEETLTTCEWTRIVEVVGQAS